MCHLLCQWSEQHLGEVCSHMQQSSHLEQYQPGGDWQNEPTLTAASSAHDTQIHFAYAHLHNMLEQAELLPISLL